MNEQLDTRFIAAQTEWDLDRLYQDLAKIKGKPLSPMEKLHLRGLLCGLSPMKIAKVLHKSSEGVHVDLAKTLYPYMAILTGKTDEGIGNWRNVREWLEKAGYKKILSPSQIRQSSSPLSFSSIAILNISNVNIVINHIERIQIGENEYIDFSGRVGPLPPNDPLKKDKQD